MIFRTTLLVLFFLSIIAAPWWYTTLLAIVIAVTGKDLFILPIGGACLDILFSGSIASLGGFSFIYTAVFSVLALVSFFIHRHIFE